VKTLDADNALDCAGEGASLKGFAWRVTAELFESFRPFRHIDWRMWFAHESLGLVVAFSLSAILMKFLGESFSCNLVSLSLNYNLLYFRSNGWLLERLLDDLLVAQFHFHGLEQDLPHALVVLTLFFQRLIFALEPCLELIVFALQAP